MTSFQRMVLVAAVLFMITAHVTAHVSDAAVQCGCFKNEYCGGPPEHGVGSVSQVTIYNLPCSMGILHY